MAEQTAQTIRGLKSVIKGDRFEQKVNAFYARKGWRLRPQFSVGKYKLDLLGVDDDSDDYLLVECKDKDRITAAEVLRFMTKVKMFCRKWPDFDVTAVFAYTGSVSDDAKRACRDHSPRISFKKF